jgi:hypothetical protein
MLAFFKKALEAGFARFENREAKSERFVTQFVEPDMLDNGFGFGRKNTCKALIALRVTSFEQLFTLSAEQLETIRTARGVGPKVFTGFQRYLAKRGVLPGAAEQEATAVATTPAAEVSTQERAPNIDVV